MRPSMRMAVGIGNVDMLLVLAAASSVLAFAPSSSAWAFSLRSANSLHSANTSPLFRRNAGQSAAAAAAARTAHARTLLQVATADEASVAAGIPVGDLDEGLPSSSDSGQFNWYKAWYPIIPVEFLDREKPQHFKLMNMDLVVWNDGKVEGRSEAFGSKKDRQRGAKRSYGTWRVFADSCPHRKVPLSEGRIEDDGTLMCSYHAWRWTGDADLCAVPQAQSENELLKIQSNPKSKCNSFPAKVVNGLLWVWPESGDDARLESALTEVPMMKLPNEVDASIDEDRIFTGTWNFRELPYSHDSFLENVVDPAHVPSSHHNVVGNRYADTNPLFVDTTKPVTKDGFEISVKQNPKEGAAVPPTSTTEFVAPGLVKIEAPAGEGAVSILELYSSPSRPGFCNHVGRQVVIKGANGEIPALLKVFLLPMPKWLNHVLAGLFLNQDALFLHAQERKMHEAKQYTTLLSSADEEPYHYTKAVLPMTADKGVVHFRNWIKNKAGGRIPYQYNPSMPSVDNEVVFDIYNSHTKHCKNCMDALQNLRKARLFSYLAAAIVGVLRPARLGAVGNVLITALLGSIGIGINKLIGAMHRLEYSHAEND